MISVLSAPVPDGASVPSQELDHALRTIFRRDNREGNGRTSAAEINRYVASVFASMDHNHDGQVSSTEFKEFSPGLQALAQRYGRTQAYDDALGRIFRRWRSAGTGTLNGVTFRPGVKGELAAAARGSLALNYDQFVVLGSSENSRPRCTQEEVIALAIRRREVV
ncbi:EF-hand domain-containing protein [Methylobacterium nigriterrae]|uniref:EF-hand domain-containing protein n=1 Tax=Methylobacterium nigriterrae TaxID=3127512 RepID=UPI00301355E8